MTGNLLAAPAPPAPPGAARRGLLAPGLPPADLPYCRAMPGSPAFVRPATSADVKMLAAVLARAFYDDPPLVWLLPDAATRLGRVTRMFATVIGIESLRYGGVDVACAGQPAYLEAGEPDGVSVYEHFGFRRIGNLGMPEGAPLLTAMWRAPAA